MYEHTRSQWQLLRNRNKPVQTIRWYLTMHGRAIACAYYCVTLAISRTGGLIHSISVGNLLGSSDEWLCCIIFSRFSIFIINGDFMTCMNEVNDWYEFVDVQCQKSMHLSCNFFICTMHEPEGECIDQMKKSQDACIDLWHLHYNKISYSVINL